MFDLVSLLDDLDPETLDGESEHELDALESEGE